VPYCKQHNPHLSEALKGEEKDISMNKAAYQWSFSVMLRGGRMGLYKGCVVSFGPSLGIVFASLMAGAATQVEAGSCTQTGVANAFLCSGAPDNSTDQQQLLETSGADGATLTIQTAPGFGIDTSAINPPLGGRQGAINILGNPSGGENEIVFLDENGAEITDEFNGVRVEGNYGGLSLRSNGHLTGVDGHGLLVEGPGYQGEVSIDVNDTTGRNSGMLIVSRGASTSIRSTGTATGFGPFGTGIYVIAGPIFTTSNLELNVKNAFGTEAGINAFGNRGNLDVIVSEGGTVSGGVDGISIRRRTSGQGTGAGSVVINGDVQGGTGAGLNNSPFGSGLDIKISETGSLSSDSGIALNDQSTGQFGDSPASALTVEGTLNGDAQMGDGADKLTMLGAAAVLGSNGATLETSPGLADGAAHLDGDRGPGSFTAGERDSLRFRGWTGNIDGAQIANWEEVFVTGNSVVTFDDSITPGTGLENENMTDGLLFQVDAGSKARFAESFAINGNVNNFGTLDLSAPNGSPNTVLTVNGDYNAASDLVLDVELGDETSPADVLIITGDTDGTTNVVINNTGGTGAVTMGDGIRVVNADPSNMLAGDFVMGSSAIAGAYEYSLFEGGLANPQDGDWYLRSSGFQPAAPIYEALPSVLLGSMQVGTLAQRIANRQMITRGGDEVVSRAEMTTSRLSSRDTIANTDVSPGAWLRVEGERLDLTPDTSTAGLSYDQATWRLQGGLDMSVYESGTGTLAAGINVFTGGSSVDVVSSVGGGDISTDANGVGLTATWFGNQGFYADAQLQYSRFDSDLSSDVVGDLASDLDGFGRLASIEIGQEFVLPSGMTLTPQAQLIWSKVSFDSFNGPNGETISLEDDDSLKLRLGLAAEQSWDLGSGDQARVYGIANVTHEMRDTTSILVSGTALSMSTPDWAGEIGFGGSYDWSNNRGATSSIYGELSASHELSSGKLRGLAGTIGLRMSW
jgi:fibronectin-binding autotransporter adhesin